MMKLTALLVVAGVAALMMANQVSSFSMSMKTSSMMTTTTPSSDSQSLLDRRSFGQQLGVVATTAFVTVGLSSSPPVAIADDAGGDGGDDLYEDFIATESGLRYKVLREGNGKIPEPGMTIKTQYTGWLDGFDSIKKIDSSRDRGRPFTFKVGAGQVIRGWDEAFSSMSVGERRQIILKPSLAYGDRGAGGIIPGGATLYFDVELVAIQ